MTTHEELARVAERACPMDMGYGPCGSCDACRAAQNIRNEEPRRKADIEHHQREIARHQAELERLRRTR